MTYKPTSKQLKEDHGLSSIKKNLSIERETRPHIANKERMLNPMQYSYNGK